MLTLILAGITLLTIIGISIYAKKKGQSGFGVFFLLYCIISIIVYIVTLPEGKPFMLVDILGQIGVIVTSIGVIVAHAKGARKILYALPGLIILGISLSIHMSKFQPPAQNGTATNQTVIMDSNRTKE
ncbi:hypothetical protein [Desulfovibrio sp. JC010]|uniref:hypothetical protein n=1 Tax=Desulfovibrio sp. JC010 TaxID=2593641 RepID=UPI0013D29E08|nr:hypothetical protein [Desulfovibrio sp. JC010]NDV27269.1 hypothetical protein [Desulfovibrio sp. JC010]